MKTELWLAERSRVEEALQESELRFRRLLAATTDYIYSVPLRDGNAAATYHGPGCETVTGYTPEEFAKDPYLWYSIIYKEDRETVLSQIERIFLGQKPPPLEHRIVHKDGSIRWIRNTPIPQQNREGKLLGYDGLITDVTSRKLAEIALKESRDQLALVIQGSNDGIWDWDILAGKSYFSPRWKSMLGYEEVDVENRFETWENLLHPEDRERALATVRSCLASAATTFELEHRLRHKDGSYRWILARAVVLRDPQGMPVRMAGSHVDLTERKLAAEQLECANAKLAREKESLRKVVKRLQKEHRELQVAQQQLQVEHRQLKEAENELLQIATLEPVAALAANVAHQVKNPLMAISTSEYILDQSVPREKRSPEVAEAIAGIKEAVTNAAAVVNELLNLSSPWRMELQRGDLNAVLDRWIGLVSLTLNKNRVRVERRFAADLPQVLMDPSRIGFVFQNLLFNSMQAMSHGGTITITTKRLFLTKDETDKTGPFCHFRPGDQVVVSELKDTGPGLAAGVEGKVLRERVTTKPRGTGLGLLIAKDVIKHHDGAIDLRNAPEGGALATVVLKA